MFSSGRLIQLRLAGNFARFENSQNVQTIEANPLTLDLGYRVGGKFAREEIGNLSMSGNRRTRRGSARLTYLLALLFVGENASEPLQVSNELSPLHLHLDLFDHYLVFG